LARFESDSVGKIGVKRSWAMKHLCHHDPTYSKQSQVIVLFEIAHIREVRGEIARSSDHFARNLTVVPWATRQHTLNESFAYAI